MLTAGIVLMVLSGAGLRMFRNFLEFLDRRREKEGDRWLRLGLALDNMGIGLCALVFLCAGLCVGFTLAVCSFF